MSDVYQASQNPPGRSGRPPLQRGQVLLSVPLQREQVPSLGAFTKGASPFLVPLQRGQKRDIDILFNTWKFNAYYYYQSAVFSIDELRL